MPLFFNDIVSGQGRKRMDGLLAGGVGHASPYDLRSLPMTRGKGLALSDAWMALPRLRLARSIGSMAT
jgi:hypothetical protein